MNILCGSHCERYSNRSGSLKNKRKAAPEGAAVAISAEVLLGGSGDRGDGHEPTALALVVELDDAVDFGEQRVIAADADVHSRIEACAALTDDDRSTGDELAGEALDAQHFRL